MRLDQRQQGLPRNNLLHLSQENFPAGLFALAQAFGVAKCQLHGWLLNMCCHCLSGSRPAAGTTGTFVQSIPSGSSGNVNSVL